MGAASRTKGAVGEREFARLARDWLGDAAVRRNLAQASEGGHDLLGLGRFAVEVKRVETLALSPWWTQARAQAERCALVPALAFRASRQPWAVLVPLAAVGPWEAVRGADAMTLAWTARLGAEAFFALVRETVDA